MTEPIATLEKKPCDGCDKTALPIANVNYVDFRRIQCDTCEYACDGECGPTAEKYPGKSLIEIGIHDRMLRCPLPEPRWTEEPMTCPACGSQKKIVQKKYGVCIVCQRRKIITGRMPEIRQPSQSLGVSIPREVTVVPNPFATEPIKHLHYFLYPRYRDSVRYHLDKLRQSIDQFNGQRVCCVVTDENTIEAEIAGELQSLFTATYFRPNDPKRRELVGFIPSLELLQTASDNEVICFAHAKGQQEHTQTASTVRKWTDACYETVVDNWPQVRDVMERGYPLAGSFKSRQAFRNTTHKWHYSGSFWWARSASIFSNPRWRITCPHWWGSESYVGRHWPADHGFCLFADNINSTGACYKPEFWQDRLDADLETFRTKQLVAI